MKGNINMEKQKRITLNAIQNLRKHGNKQKKHTMICVHLQKLKLMF